MPAEGERGVIRGADELAAWWGRVPIARLRFRAQALPDGTGLATLAGGLRAAAWRERCAAPGPACADAGRPCCADPAHCAADRLYPMQLGGGGPAWRMATLHLRWLPASGELQLLALGMHARQELGWAGRWLQHRHGVPLLATDETDLPGLLPAPATHWRVRLVTPWLVGKRRRVQPLAAGVRERRDVDAKLADALAARGHKFTALALEGNPAQALAGHLARYVAREVSQRALRVVQCGIEALDVPLPLESSGNRERFRGIAWVGEFELKIDPQAQPWLALLALSGLGENADEGFGAVELQALG